MSETQHAAQDGGAAPEQPLADDLKTRWWAWHEANPRVWALFERFAREALDHGTTRLSGWMIVNRIRWELAVETKGKLKVGNDLIAPYVRLFQRSHPQYASMFVTKPVSRRGKMRRAKQPA